MAVPRRRLLVFSDLDGTLLDKETYSWAPAAGAIRALAERGIPLILSCRKPAAAFPLVLRTAQVWEIPRWLRVAVDADRKEFAPGS